MAPWNDEKSDGDDGASSFANFAKDDNSDAGSVMSGYTSVSAGGRMEDSRYSHFPRGPGGSTIGTSYRRGPPSVASSGRRVALVTIPAWQTLRVIDSSRGIWLE